MEEETKPGAKGAFYTLPNQAQNAPGMPADVLEEGERGAPPEAAGRVMAAYDAEFPESEAKQKKRLRAIFGISAFAVALCALALAAGALGIGGLSLAAPKGTAPVLGAQDINAATVYLNSLPWDRKPHDSLKHLEKMKNVRSSLQFFGRYSAGEIAGMKAERADPDGAAARYDALAGSLVEMNAKAVRISAVDEGITLGADSSASLVTLGQPGKIGAASLLVIGALPEGVGEGKALSFKCIPVYLYVPKEGMAQGGIFFITLSGLVSGE